MDADEVISALRPHLVGALIATDFDGTLAPIVSDPERSQPIEGTVEVLRALSGRGARVAVVTGRDAATAVRLGGFDAVPGLVVEGLYGAETWQDGDLSAPAEPVELGHLRERLPSLVAEHAGDPNVWVEDKRLSLVVHTRRAGDPDAALRALTAPMGALAAELGLELHSGRAVLEIRLPGFDKGTALRGLIDRFNPPAVLFAGDDVGDLPAFATIVELRAAGTPAWSVAAASAEVPELADAADVTVNGPTGVVALLRRLG